ncbi:MAG TPA: RagB/SusD family nutrient uptake outer membrane protein, partial [Draconibacterium sp.]|nr:RagB/SusD family nutrient uptake outer membrane protein [Draconibacterium sp.]
GDWDVAKNAALSVIGSNQFEIIDAVNYANSWKKDTDVNSIFELAFDSSDNNGIEGLQYIYRGAMYGDIEVLNNLRTIFDENDVRNSPEMIGNLGGKLRNLGKYPSNDFSDNVSLIRYEEVILILAEAKLQLGEDDALDILNEVPAKRNATLYTEATLENILLERRKELCFEGFRFDDLARTGSDIPLVDPLHQTHGGPAYGSYKYAFAIPSVEMNANPNMVQNDGYQ